MKLFSDKNLTKEITILDLGVVEAGESKQFSFWVLNDSLAKLERLEFLVEHNEVEIKKAPEELLSNTSDELIIEWNPNITIREGLHVELHIHAIELWG